MNRRYTALALLAGESETTVCPRRDNPTCSATSGAAATSARVPRLDRGLLKERPRTKPETSPPRAPRPAPRRPTWVFVGCANGRRSTAFRGGSARDRLWQLVAPRATPPRPPGTSASSRDVRARRGGPRLRPKTLAPPRRCALTHSIVPRPTAPSGARRLADLSRGRPSSAPPHGAPGPPGSCYRQLVGAGPARSRSSRLPGGVRPLRAAEASGPLYTSSTTRAGAPRPGRERAQTTRRAILPGIKLARRRALHERGRLLAAAAALAQQGCHRERLAGFAETMRGATRASIAACGGARARLSRWDKERTGSRCESLSDKIFGRTVDADADAVGAR